MILENENVVLKDHNIFHTESSLLQDFSTPVSSPVKEAPHVYTAAKSPVRGITSPVPYISPTKKLTAAPAVVVDVGVLQSHTETLLKLNEELKADLSKATRQCDTLRRVSDQRQEALDAATRDAEHHHHRADTLADQLTLLKEQFNEVSRENNTLQQRLIISEKERTVVEGTLGALRAENNGLLIALEEREAAINRLRAEIKSTTANNAGRSFEIERLHQDNATLSAQNRLLMQDLVSAQTEVEHLRRLVAVANATVNMNNNMHRPYTAVSNSSSPDLLLTGCNEGGVVDDQHEGEVANAMQGLRIGNTEDARLARNWATSLSPSTMNNLARYTAVTATGSTWRNTDSAAVGGGGDGLATNNGDTQFKTDSTANKEAETTTASEQQQQQKTTPTRAPFVAPATPEEFMQRVQTLEDRLLKLNQERDALDSEYARMPSTSAGRTGAERRRKGQVEERLGELVKEIASVRYELKRLGCR